MTTSNFFTILHKYLHCCVCRCCNEKLKEEDAFAASSHSSFNNTNDINSQFTFDDMSSPSTTVTLSSSSSSLDSLNEYRYHPTYKRKNTNISIIPSYYYDND